MRARSDPDGEDDDQVVTPPRAQHALAPRGNRLRTRVGEIDIPDVAVSGELVTRALTPIPIFFDDDV